MKKAYVNVAQLFRHGFDRRMKCRDPVSLLECRPDMAWSLAAVMCSPPFVPGSQDQWSLSLVQTRDCRLGKQGPPEPQ